MRLRCCDAELSDEQIVGTNYPQSAARNPQSPLSDLPERLVAHYREMLRAYVVMGAGNLADEMATLANLLTEADVSAQRTMQLHVHVLEELIGSLGNRSARHVMIAGRPLSARNHGPSGRWLSAALP